MEPAPRESEPLAGKTLSRTGQASQGIEGFCGCKKFGKRAAGKRAFFRALLGSQFDARGWNRQPLATTHKYKSPGAEALVAPHVHSASLMSRQSIRCGDGMYRL